MAPRALAMTTPELALATPELAMTTPALAMATPELATLAMALAPALAPALATTATITLELALAQVSNTLQPLSADLTFYAIVLKGLPHLAILLSSCLHIIKPHCI